MGLAWSEHASQGEALLKGTRSMAGTHSWPQGSRQGLDLLPRSRALTPDDLSEKTHRRFPLRLSPALPRKPSAASLPVPTCARTFLNAAPSLRIPALTWLPSLADRPTMLFLRA